jgi:hypothetical protein
MIARTSLAPAVHFFACANVRDAGSPLGAGCGARGEAVYDALKAEVARRGAFATAWVTKTACLGLCPRRGSALAVYCPRGSVPQRLFEDVAPSDARDLLDRALAEFAVPAAAPPPPPSSLAPRLAKTLAEMEELQRAKVVDLARRLRPGLTSEDLQSPHDFPELDDPDWHYADGMLAGIQAVVMALRAGGLLEGAGASGEGGGPT